METINKLKKSAILELTMGGWLYFISLFTELKHAKINDRRCRNIINHIRGEKNASLSCFYKNDRWMLYDHADPDFKGDVFDIYGLINEITEFPKILEGLYREITGEEPPNSYKEGVSNMEEIKLPEGVEFEIERMDFNNLDKAENEFLKKFQINEESMKEYNSHFLSAYSFTASNGKQYRITKKPKEVIIAHIFGDSVKIYKPYANEFKYQWLGKKPKDYVYGIENLKVLFKDYKYNRESVANQKFQLILSAGEKDTLILRSLGLNAVCLNSETSSYFPESLYIYLLDFNDLLHEDFELLVVYDIDEAGKKYAERIKEKQANYDYKLRVVELPEILAENGGKDIADWISLGLSKDELLSVITNSESPISAISPQALNNEEPNDGVIEKTAEKKIETSIREIPKVIYQNFPKLLQDALEPFESEHKTMMTLAFLTVLSSITTNVKANFRWDKLYANLYTIIIAPPASGKSLIKWARKLVMSVEKFLDKRSKKWAQKYQELVELVEKGEMNKAELGEEPPYQLLLIPADITSAMLLKQSFDNDGKGLMFDTEIDGLVQSNQGNLRSFTDFLRKNYEGEPLSVMRKTNRERITIEEGKMSLLLSGTPGQFMKLIPDAENGLFSRIIPYYFNGSSEWQPAFDPDSFDFESYFEDLSETVLNYYQELESFPEPILFSLTSEQLTKLDQVFSERLNKINLSAGIDGAATVKRLAPIVAKVAMILNILRRFEEGNIYNQNSCHPDDFKSAMIIAEVILSHVLSTLKIMKDERIENIYQGKKKDYYYALPNKFTYRDSQTIAEDLGIKLKTAEKWVHAFRNKGFLINPEKGSYLKVA
ncbi:DUF3987 domain-containing protein [Galbibacter sp.]|uniref:DUF3987 domain-containing protein n=1 Tax=Galbibacter sp. TaxID=2918471 RepID=UPI003A8E02B1